MHDSGDRITRQIIDISRQKKVFCELKSKIYCGDTLETFVDGVLESSILKSFILIIVLLDFIKNEYN